LYSLKMLRGAVSFQKLFLIILNFPNACAYQIEIQLIV
jgi:hypothetical protein